MLSRRGQLTSPAASSASSSSPEAKASAPVDSPGSSMASHRRKVDALIRLQQEQNPEPRSIMLSIKGRADGIGDV